MAPGKKLAAATLVASALIGALATGGYAGQQNTSAGKSQTSGKAGAATSATRKATPTSPAERKYSGPPVLDPARFPGLAGIGYAAAKKIPEIVSQLFCYCGCDVSDDHKYLIDCFTGAHGVDCHICQEEAILALRMSRDGASMTEIQQAVDLEFAKQYPFDEHSPTYKKYQASRLWTKTAESSSSTKGKDKPDEWKPVVKPGMKAGECCGKEKHGK